MAFVEPDPKSAFDHLAIAYGPEIIHPGIPEEISHSLGVRDGQITSDDIDNQPKPLSPPEQFFHLHRLVSALFTAQSESLRNHVLSLINDDGQNQPDNQVDLNPYRLKEIQRALEKQLDDTPNSSRNYAYLVTIDRLCQALAKA
jgi:hypothetical protein